MTITSVIICSDIRVWTNRSTAYKPFPLVTISVSPSFFGPISHKEAVFPPFQVVWFFVELCVPLCEVPSTSISPAPFPFLLFVSSPYPITNIVHLNFRPKVVMDAHGCYWGEVSIFIFAVLFSIFPIFPGARPEKALVFRLLPAFWAWLGTIFSGFLFCPVSLDDE